MLSSKFSPLPSSQIEKGSTLPPKKYIIQIALILSLGSMALLSSLLYWRYNREFFEAQANSKIISELLASQAGRVMQALNLSHRSVSDYIDRAGVRSTVELQRLTGERPTYEYLRLVELAVSPLQGVLIADAEGKVRAISKSYVTTDYPHSSIQGRDYYEYYANGGNEESYIGKSIQNRHDGEWTIPISYKISGPDDRFIGLVICAIPLKYFENYYQSIKSNSNVTVSLHRIDGTLLASSLTEEDRSAVTSGNSPLNPAGYVVLPSGNQIVSTSLVDDAPLFVRVTSPVSQALSSWFRELIIGIIIALILNLSILIAVFLALKQLQTAKNLVLVERFAARHDVLTGLPNRFYFQEQIEIFYTQAIQAGKSFALILFDVDHFKEVNDTFGHKAGDDLLRIIALRLIEWNDQGKFLARLGGDEFAVIDVGGTTVGICNDVGASLVHALRQPFIVKGRHVMTSASIGVAMASPHEKSSEVLFDNADLALYHAKASGRGKHILFSDQLRDDELENRALALDLQEAFEAKSLLLVYQPIVDLRLKKVVGFEALLRWNDPKRGMVPPAKFIPVAEDTRLIIPLGEWVLVQACREAMAWPSEIYVAVNLSPVQLRFSDVRVQVEAALANTKLQATRLEVEITESVQLDSGGSGQTLHDLRAMGVGVSLDDFGTGYASLSYLRSFPFDRIKIDQSFVREMLISKNSAAIVDTAVYLADRMDIVVTGEGVETVEQIERLRKIGCTKAQGFLIGRPMPAEDVQVFLRSWQYPVSTEEPCLSSLVTG
ncbi:EAL domain-containing protein [Methylobacterium sp. 10]|uniref:bifunctional diguanylate cyclase/phosphodiesterase n=1 Tax=Methylobacterium sp. 10 TaxID=1101191 RepID=UPI0004B4664A|nr:EAL domain-containing protein [Methylobacterium sp. 10]